MALKVRRAVATDANQIAKAEAMTARLQPGLLLASPGEIPVERFREMIRDRKNSGLYLVAEEEGELIGHLLINPLPLRSIQHVGSLTIVVHPGRTGQKVGTRLMQAAIEWAREDAQIRKLELRVRSTNARAIRLYESFGFEREGLLKRHARFGEDEVDEICMALFVDNVKGPK